jgi:aerobic-type carbon monoxide dehydrogenase small subunit (CoxS/CutS family)
MRLLSFRHQNRIFTREKDLNNGEGNEKMKESINTKVAVFCSDCVHKNVCKWEYKVKEAEDKLEKAIIDELCTTICRPYLAFNCPEKINAKEHFL